MSSRRSRKSIREAAGAVVECYSRAGKVIATAESCTGGYVAASLTDIAGSSAVFDRGFVTYSNQAKVELLGVSTETLLKHGAVSMNTAAEMAKGAAQRSGADISVSVTGIAGPDGGTTEKPVGLVYMAFADRGGTVVDIVELNHPPDADRETIRLETTRAALMKIERLLPSIRQDKD